MILISDKNGSAIEFSSLVTRPVALHPSPLRWLRACSLVESDCSADADLSTGRGISADAIYASQVVNVGLPDIEGSTRQLSEAYLRAIADVPGNARHIIPGDVRAGRPGRPGSIGAVVLLHDDGTAIVHVLNN